MKTYIITGATGFLGKRLVRHLLMNGHCMILLVRGENRKTAEERISKLFNFSESESRRIHTFDCDTRYLDKIFENQEFQEIIATHTISGIWHLAANISFRSKDKDVVHDTNVTGTQSVARFAKALNVPLFHVSTAYVHGKKDGFLEEDALITTRFNNHYEHSKFISERHLRNEIKGGLQCLIFRLGNLIDVAPEYNVKDTFGYYAILEAVHDLSVALRNFIYRYPILSRIFGFRIDALGVVHSTFIPFVVARVFINLVPVGVAISVMEHITNIKDKVESDTFQVVSTNALSMREIAVITFDELKVRIPIITLPQMLVSMIFKFIYVLSRVFPPFIGLSKKLHYYGYYMTNTYRFDTTRIEKVYGREQYRNLFKHSSSDLRNASRSFVIHKRTPLSNN